MCLTVLMLFLDISTITGMTHEDVANTLVDLGYLQSINNSIKLVVDADDLQQRVADLRPPKHAIGMGCKLREWLLH
jgi:hypothetical protein